MDLDQVLEVLILADRFQSSGFGEVLAGRLRDLVSWDETVGKVMKHYVRLPEDSEYSGSLVSVRPGTEERSLSQPPPLRSHRYLQSCVLFPFVNKKLLPPSLSFPSASEDGRPAELAELQGGAAADAQSGPAADRGRHLSAQGTTSSPCIRMFCEIHVQICPNVQTHIDNIYIYIHTYKMGRTCVYVDLDLQGHQQ